jgi:protein involved in polysaccharide export with SLBB domain
MKSILSVFIVMALAVIPMFGQIQVGKSVSISILGVPPEEKGRVDGAYPVADNGTINMPFIGSIQAAGLKPESLAAALEARYRSAQIYRNPTFQVVSDTEGAALDESVVHMGGQIGRTGPVKFQRGLTLWQAIQSAGGPSPFGTLKRVQLLRNGKQRQYDLTQLENKQITLEPNDSIEVPQKRPWETK